MKYNPDIHHRRSIRLKRYDYSRAGTCFLTVCTHQRECLFGDIAAGKMRLNAAGKIAVQYWNEIPTHFPHVQLDGFVVMPNHVHGILVIMGAGNANRAKDPILNWAPLKPRATTPEPNGIERPHGTSKTLGSVVRGFKIGVTKWIRKHTTVFEVWQRNYWEHIIRDEYEMNRIREYVATNPAKWETDRLNPCWNGP
jgi:putative transposase